MRRAPLLLTVAALAALLAGCGPRYHREVVFDHEVLKVTLRSQIEDGERVDRGFAHPATISSVRIAHILSRIDVREGEDEGGARKPAFQTVLLYTVGEKMALAFAQADPSQEVVVRAVRKEKRFGIFTAKYLTSFTAHMIDDDLVIQLSRVDWMIPKDQEDEGLPEPYPDRTYQEFKVLPAEGLVPFGKHAVVADWRDPIFREPTHVRVGPGGKLMRRQILMEAPPEIEAEGEELPLVPADLSAETLRALADLQEQRAAGEISETMYYQQRRDILRKAAEESEPTP